ncbi:MAG: hypothetical protein ACYDHF_04860 [Candidatus Cryosericum sp.]|jgi:hypothetical protein
MDDQKAPLAGEPELATLYLETLVAKVDSNKYRLIRRLIDASHEQLEEKTDPLREPVDDILRKSAARLLGVAARSAAAPVPEEPEANH